MKSKKLPELAVIGWPLEKTFSPIIQNAALKTIGFDWKYEAIPVPPECLSEFFKEAAGQMVGFNVTIPHKNKVFELCDVKSPFAKICQAVNTVVFKKMVSIKAFGYNTDGPALIKALRIRKRNSINSALILGAGGAASAAVASILLLGAKHIFVANRTLQRAQELVDHFAKLFPKSNFEILNLDEKQIIDILKQVEIVINCLPEGAAALLEGCFSENGRGKVFCDYSYSEKPTLLYSRAKGLGYTTISGIEILVWQGAYAFEIFTNRKCPVEEMIDSLKERIGSWWLEC
ncbi:shikimate dehydrogenase [Pseudothermotoga thermarum]|uniref:shikimate dehydrogenase (NADP(+)) n=1 Tax=Pseudothermotoga thermarum DSM 5069 TaxID=688269 RepID=F7YWZ1_9THEM|nr:shikimate dehydrogenase [Pseudothermotoga thermarum]AEH50583.1 Shikimate dehydrogenase substrate binding domain protein [Pseudothermotoga thermarum DSM 5069]